MDDPEDSNLAVTPLKIPHANHIGFVLRRAQVSVFQDFMESTAAFGITPAEYSALAILRDNPGIRHHRLTELLFIKPANCVTLIARLETRGLVRREKLPVSGRSVAFTLSDDGLSFLKQVDICVEDHLQRTRQRLGPARTQQLLDLLNCLISPGAVGPE